MTDQYSGAIKEVVTSKGVLEVKPDHKPVPASQHYAGRELPPGSRDQLVYVTARGREVIAKPVSRQTWTKEHTAQAEKMADELKTHIDANGFYRRKLKSLSHSLSMQNGWEPNITRQEIVSAFEQKQGLDPYKYLGNKLGRGPDKDRAPEQEIER